MKTTTKTTGYTFYEKTILDNIDLESYEIKGFENMNEFEQVKEIYDIFKSEYLHDYNIKRFGSEINIFKEWLMGVPSALTVPFYYYDILEKAREYGKEYNDNYFLKTVRNEDKFLDEYFLNLSKAFFTLKDNL